VIVIHLARKPLSEGTVAANALKHGTGTLNVDGSRLGTPEDTTRPSYGTALGIMNDDSWKAHNLSETGGHVGGRWPANLILEHRPGCRQSGPRQVRGTGSGGRATPKKNRHTFAQDSYTQQRMVRSTVSHADEGGMETVDVWGCSPGCPVTSLDKQSDETSRFFLQVQAEFDVERASGDAICGECGKPYRGHPLDHHQREHPGGDPYLNVLCDGARVKL